MGDTSGTGIVYLSGAPEFTLGFKVIGVTQSLVFYVVFFRSLFVLSLLVIVLCPSTSYDF